MQITFIGTGDAVNSGGRGHSCYWVDDDLGCYMVDFGPTALMQCRRFAKDPNRLDTLFITHLHGDHIGGLAVLLIELRYLNRRQRPLTLVGPPGLQARVTELCAASYPGLLCDLSFALIFAHMPVPGRIEIGGRTVHAIKALHDSTAMAASLRVETGAGVLAFSGDSGWQPSLGLFAAGADVFVCECSGVEPGYPMHMDVQTHVAQRARFHCRHLVLSHLSSAAREAASVLADVHDWTVADDGLVLTVDTQPT